MTVVAIHQPNFFPWLGYFDKIARCDVFVFLDHVQYPKTGGNWSNRVQLIVGGRSQWVTAPIDRAFSGVRAINELEFAARPPWRERFRKTVVANYGRTPFFTETMACLEPILADADDNLSRFNGRAIRRLIDHVGLKVPALFRSSELDVTGSANDLLISIAAAVGADTYLCGGGSSEYFDATAFAAAGLTLQYQHFSHPTYAQRPGDGFVAGLSIVDALMNCGRAQVGRMLQSRGDRGA
jgi:hypothetical protein